MCIICEMFVCGWCLLIIVRLVLFNSFVIVWVWIILLIFGEIIIMLLKLCFFIFFNSIGLLNMLLIGMLKKFWICLVCKLIVNMWLILILERKFVIILVVIGIWVECIWWFWCE